LPRRICATIVISEELTSLVWSGLRVGAIGGLLGIAIVLCFRSTRILNLAVGAFYLVGAFMYSGLTGAGIPVGLALVLAAFVGVVAGLVEERVVLRPLRNARPFTKILATLGFAIVISGLIVVIEGKQPVSAPSLVGGGWTLAGTSIAFQGVALVAFAVLTGVSLHLWSTRTATGQATIAISDDDDAAMMLGINVEALRIGSYGLAGGLSALAGVLGIPLFLSDFSSGVPLSLSAFVAAMIGGGLSVIGELAGGIAVGVTVALLMRVFSASFSEMLISLLLIAVVLFAARFPAFQKLQ